MRFQSFAALLALFLLAPSAHANEGEGFGVCDIVYVDGDRVTTESHGEMPIAEVQVNDRVWSFHGSTERLGWSKVLKRVEGGRSYKLLIDFTELGSSVVIKGCILVKRSS